MVTMITPTMAIACIIYIMIGIFLTDLFGFYDDSDAFGVVTTFLWPVFIAVGVAFYVVMWLPHKLAVKVRESKWWKKWNL